MSLSYSILKGYPASRLRELADHGLLYIKYGEKEWMMHKVRKPNQNFDEHNIRVQQRAGRLYKKDIT